MKNEIYTANRFYREKFGKKLIKLSIDGGFTCPNRDGTAGTGGCIFCSGSGSGDFAAKGEDIKKQAEEAKARLNEKWGGCDCEYMVYFQAYTNTYAPTVVLREKYLSALEAAGAAAISIATRPDCIDKEKTELLKEISRKYYVTVELGLQTSNEKTAEFINRGYKNAEYINAVNMLKNAGIDVITHIILGLPGETKADMRSSVDFAVNAGTKGLKLQLLHILKGTKLAKIYAEKPFRLFEKEEYINFICDILEDLPEDIVIHRMTGDAPKALMIQPWWSLDKRSVLNGIAREWKKRREKNTGFE